jgi:hypothetical protein
MRKTKKAQPVVPCLQSTDLASLIEQFAEALKTETHKIGTHGLSEREFYQSGILEGAIQRVRGEYSATMREKRDFVARVLNYMQDGNFISEWEPSGQANRFDYSIRMPSGKMSVIELKGCLDGNNTLIFDRPQHAQEFIIWSVCPNAASNLRHNVWSGISRLGADIIERQTLVDGLVVWDWYCGGNLRKCPKMERRDSDRVRLTEVGQFTLPPPCVYLLPRTVPTVRNNPNPEPHTLKEVEFLHALNTCFKGFCDEINRIRIKVAYKGTETVRTTSVERGGVLQKESLPVAIRRK